MSTRTSHPGQRGGVCGGAVDEAKTLW